MIRYRVCCEPGCPNVVEGQSRCDECRSAHERARGTRTQRGYGVQHQAAKTRLKGEGHTHCASCGEPFTDDNPMETGHLVAVREGGTGAEGYAPHCRACNRGWRRTGI